MPVACLTCGKLFQVPTSAAGTRVRCPWCRAATPALPVAGAPAADPGPPGQPAPAEPLSLDPDPPPPAGSRRTGRKIILTLAGAAAVAAATAAGLGYGAGRVPTAAWAEFRGPEGGWTALLPGTPAGEAVPPIPAAPVTRGGRRYATTGWYSRATAWVEWQELDPGWAKTAAADRDGTIAAPVLAAARDRRKELAGGTVVREVPVRYGAGHGVEVEMDTPRGQLVERLILAAGGPTPRLYGVGIEARRLAAGGPAALGPAANRLLASFRIHTD